MNYQATHKNNPIFTPSQIHVCPFSLPLLDTKVFFQVVIYSKGLFHLQVLEPKIFFSNLFIKTLLTGSFCYKGNSTFPFTLSPQLSWFPQKLDRLSLRRYQNYTRVKMFHRKQTIFQIEITTRKKKQNTIWNLFFKFYSIKNVTCKMSYSSSVWESQKVNKVTCMPGTLRCPEH